MKATPKCRPCLQRLAYQAVELATCDRDIRKAVLAKALQVLDEQFSYQQVSIIVAASVHKIVRECTANYDPYREMKAREIMMARELLPIVSRRYGYELSDCIKLAALGNAVDFFRDLEAIKADIMRPLKFIINDTDRFAEALKKAHSILFLGDNAGEMLFDLPLLRLLRQAAHVSYVVKSSPVQDDTTYEEICAAGLESEIGHVITTGTATPGIDFSNASVEFRRAFESADIFFAKGMGYYESLTELPVYGRVFYCLMAKCEPVAESLGVPLLSYVMKHQ